MEWARLFERAEASETTVEAVRESLARRRGAGGGETNEASDGHDDSEGAEDGADTEPGADDGRDASDDSRTAVSSARVVADADVLAADLLCGGPARAALDHVRRHAWVTLVASEQLLADAEAIVREHGDPGLAADWRARIDADSERVEHPAGDHPGLASAYRGGAAHLLSYDDDLRSVETGLALQPHMQLSVRPPDAFAALFDPEPLYETVEGGAYPGPDRDPRA